MLTPVVHFPSIYGSLDGGEPMTRSECGLIVRILDDVRLGGVLLVDQDGVILRDIGNRRTRWPTEANAESDKARRILEGLAKRGRVVKAPVETAIGSCANGSCGLAVGLARHLAPSGAIVVTPATCDVCPECLDLFGCPVVRVHEYETSSLSDELRNDGSLTYAGGAAKAKFEREVLVPLFRFAKHVKILDRYIGRSALTDQGVEQYNHARFLDTLAWFYEVFAETSRSRSSGTFEVFTGMNTDPGQREGLAWKFFSALADDSQRRLAGFAANRMSALGPRAPKFSIYVATDPWNRTLPHDRYLVTEQEALVVTRGFDLLRMDGKTLEEVTISRYTGDVGELESRFRGR